MLTGNLLSGKPYTDNPLDVIAQIRTLNVESECNVKGNLVCFTYCMSSVHSPDGSYTEDHSTETGMQFKSRSTEFDEEFDDEEPLPTIGTCKALYPFEGKSTSQTISLRPKKRFPGFWIMSLAISVCVCRPERGHHIHGRGRDAVRDRGGQG